MIIDTNTAEETERVGERLAAGLVPGTVVGLCGPLGAGKTTLVRGIARGLGVAEDSVHSPTFVTATEYRGRLLVHHVDLYRHDAALPSVDWLAELLDGEGVAVVEWFEHLGDEQPPDALRIAIGYRPGSEQRRLELHATGARAAGVLRALDGADHA